MDGKGNMEGCKGNLGDIKGNTEGCKGNIDYIKGNTEGCKGNIEVQRAEIIIGHKYSVSDRIYELCLWSN